MFHDPRVSMVGVELAGLRVILSAVLGHQPEADQLDDARTLEKLGVQKIFDGVSSLEIPVMTRIMMPVVVWFRTYCDTQPVHVGLPVVP